MPHAGDLGVAGCSQGNGVSGDFPPSFPPGKPAETQRVLLNGRSSVCSPAHSRASLLILRMRMCRRPETRLPPHPLPSCITCLLRVSRQQRAGSLVRCLAVPAPRSLGKRFPCSWREARRALLAGGTSRMPAPALLLRQNALAT